MTAPSNAPRYPLASIHLHWLTFLLVVLAYVFMEFREIFERGSAGREFMKATHYSLGLTILGLTLARLVVRITGGPAPAITPPLAAWQKHAAHLVHLALYAFLIVMPLVGWATLSADGEPVRLFGLELPALIGRDKILGGRLEELHEAGGTLGYLLIGGHALMAIVHHAVMKDDTLLRMLPGRRPASSAP